MLIISYKYIKVRNIIIIKWRRGESEGSGSEEVADGKKGWEALHHVPFSYCSIS